MTIRIRYLGGSKSTQWVADSDQMPDGQPKLMAHGETPQDAVALLCSRFENEVLRLQNEKEE